MSYYRKTCHHRHSRSRQVENVLVLQGGGSFGAFGCGVFKGLSKSGVKLDIVAGTSIGAINGAIIAGSKGDHPEQALEEFWLELAESSHNIIPDLYILDAADYLSFSYKAQQEVKRIPSASINASLFGIPKMFVPRWLDWQKGPIGELFMPWNWTFAYDHSPLVNTLDKYIDYRKISPDGIKESSFDSAGKSNRATAIRLITTAVNVLTSESLVFDSAKMAIQPKHLLASSGYPVYGFPWIEIEDGVYAWDGSLLSNTPLREVIDASPRNDKHVIIVENYSRHIDRLPSNAAEVVDRTRDIIFSDKTMHNIKMSKIITKQIELIEHLYEFFERNADPSKIGQTEIDSIRKQYSKLVSNYGAEILSVRRIIKDRIATPHLLKNADFSPKTVKQLIREGEQKAIKHFSEFADNPKAADALT